MAERASSMPVPASPETARDLAARHNRALLPIPLMPQDVRPARSPETARDLAARHKRTLLPIPLMPQDVRPARYSQSQTDLTRRNLLRMAALLPVSRVAAQMAPGPAGEPVAPQIPVPEGFRIYTDAPRLFLLPARLKLLRRERERRSLRWDQFETLWQAGTQYPEFGWTAALRYMIAQDEGAGRQAVAWAASATSTSDAVSRQIALIADWCAPLMAASDKALIFPKLARALTAAPAGTGIAAARTKTLAAIALADAQPAASEKALREVYEGFWIGTFIPGLRDAKLHIPNADANAMLELIHAFRDNLNFDLRETFPKWFKDYPLAHILAHYPEPFPAAENEYRIPADPELDKRGPDVTKATFSRAAELAMVALDSNAMETQLLQGFLMNDRFLMRGALGIPYELMWANPYQPGLSYYHVPLVVHDAIGGELYVRSSWEADASWLGFFGGQLQLFANGELARVDPKVAHDPIDVVEATVFFARQATKFRVPERMAATGGEARNDTPGDKPDANSDVALDDVFIIGLEAQRRYHVEVDGEGMLEATSDLGGIIYLPGLPAGAKVRFGLAPAI